MRIKILSVTIAVAGLALAGCSKQEPTGASETGTTSADTAATDLTKTVEAAKTAGEKAVADVSKQVQETTAAASAKIQGLIDKAKNLIAENKYQDASAVIQELTGYKLTPEQQKLVDGLKEQIQKALASKAATDGASAVGGLVPKK
jgi:ElaB/YqjD/DUF883 family membrane-anchored ribosome-binding protein